MMSSLIVMEIRRATLTTSAQYTGIPSKEEETSTTLPPLLRVDVSLHPEIRQDDIALNIVLIGQTSH